MLKYIIMNELLTNEDIKKCKYPIDVLTKNIGNLSIKTLLQKQHLDASFCKKYILNEEYQTVEDNYLITFEYVLKCQPHLKYEDLLEKIS